MQYNYNDMFGSDLLKGLNKLKTELREMDEVLKGMSKHKIGVSSNSSELKKVEKDLKSINDVKEQSIKIDKDFIALEKQLEKDAKKQLQAQKLLAKEQKKTDAQAKKSFKSLISLSKQKQKQDEKLSVSAQKRKIQEQEITQSIKKTARAELILAKAHQKGAKSIADLKRINNELNRQRESMTVTTRKERKEFDRLTKSISNNEKKLKRYDKSIGRSQRNVGNYKSALKGLAGAFGLMGAGMLVLGVFKDSINIFKDFEKKVSNLQAVSKSSDETMAKLKNQAKELGAVSAFSASQILDLDTELAKLGFSGTDIEQSVAGIQALSSATGYGISESAKLAGSSLKIFDLAMSESSHVADVLAKSTSTSALDMEKLATALPIVGTTAKIANVSLEQTTAQLGILANRGIDASSSATGLRNIYLELSKQGLTWAEAQEQINNATDKNAVAMKLFGKRSATTAIILAQSKDGVDELTKSLINSGGTAKDMGKIMLDNLAGDITLASSAWEGFILNLEDGGGSLNSAMRSAVQLWTAILTTFTEDNAITRVFSELKKLSGELISAFKGLFAVLNEGKSDEEKTAELIQSIADALTFLLIPTKAVIKTITWLINGFVHLYKSSAIFKGVIDGLGKAIDVMTTNFKKLLILMGLLDKTQGLDNIGRDARKTEKELEGFLSKLLDLTIKTKDNTDATIDNTDATDKNNKAQKSALEIAKEQLKNEQERAKIKFAKKQATELNTFLLEKPSTDQLTEYKKKQAIDLLDFELSLKYQYYNKLQSLQDIANKSEKATLQNDTDKAVTDYLNTLNKLNDAEQPKSNKVENKLQEYNELKNLAQANYDFDAQLRRNEFESVKTSKSQKVEFEKQEEIKLLEFKKLQLVDYLNFVVKNNENLTEIEKRNIATQIATIEGQVANLKKKEDKPFNFYTDVLGLSDENAQIAQQSLMKFKDALSDALGTLIARQDELIAKSQENQENIQKELDAEIDKNEKLIKSGQNYDKEKIRSLQKKLRAEERMEKIAMDKRRKLANVQKAIDIGMAISGTATAVINALKLQPFYVGLAMAAVAGATGALQIAKISSQKYAKGTTYVDDNNAPNGIDTVSAMLTKGEAVVPKGEVQKMPNGWKLSELAPAMQQFYLNRQMIPAMNSYNFDTSTGDNLLSKIEKNTQRNMIFDNNGKLISEIKGKFHYTYN